MEELTPYRGQPKDLSVAVAFREATLGWDAVSLQKEKNNPERLGMMSREERLFRTVFFSVSTQYCVTVATCLDCCFTHK